jgi:predicted XRE-type DNA-binding protein/phage-related protein
LALALRQVIFRDNALEDLRLFPTHAKRDAGYQLDLVQHYRAPDNWKPFEQTATGVHEICLTDEAGVQRFVSILVLDSGIHVLHSYQRTSPKSNQRDTEKIVARYDALLSDIPPTQEQFNSVWSALENSNESAQNMRLRSTIMRLLREHIHKGNLNAADAARKFGITQPRLQDLQRGYINLFGLESLVSMAAYARLHIELSIRYPE